MITIPMILIHNLLRQNNLITAAHENDINKLIFWEFVHIPKKAPQP